MSKLDTVGGMWKNFHDTTQVHNMEEEQRAWTQATFYAGCSAVLRIMAGADDKEEMVRKLLMETGTFALSTMQEYLAAQMKGNE